MTNAERILDAIAADSGVSDSELRQRTGVQRHQQVNQICRRLESQGTIIRRSRPDGLIGNFLGLRPPRPAFVPQAQTSAVRPLANTSNAKFMLAAPEGAVMLMPCSGAKATGGLPGLSGHSVLDVLNPALASRLREARQRLAPAAKVDERLLRPAWLRYTGGVYKAAHPALAAAVAEGRPLVIVSGGYGLLFPTEPIGWYDRQFSARDWPLGLLEECLLDLVRSSSVSRVIGFFAETTRYAKLVWKVRWSSAGIQTTLATPKLEGRPGALRESPIASGESIVAYLGGSLHGGWQSSSGVRVDLERLS